MASRFVPEIVRFTIPRTQTDHTKAGRSPLGEFRIQSSVPTRPSDKFPCPGLRRLELRTLLQEHTVLLLTPSLPQNCCYQNLTGGWTKGEARDS